jgi:hypothetical protein
MRALCIAARRHRGQRTRAGGSGGAGGEGGASRTRQPRGQLVADSARKDAQRLPPLAATMQCEPVRAALRAARLRRVAPRSRPA